MRIALDSKGEALKFKERKNNREDTQTYVDKHPFAYGDPIVWITMKVEDEEKVKFHLFDAFGPTVKFSRCKEDPHYLLAKFYANTIPVKAWALGRTDEVEVLEPESLREELMRAAEAAVRTYSNSEKT